LPENVARMERNRNSKLRKWEISLLMSLAFTIPLAILHFTSMQSMDGGEDDDMTTAMHEDLLPSIKDWLGLLLATPVHFGVGRRFYQNAYRGLVHGRTMGMDFLVMMGMPSAYLYSVIVFVLRIVAADRDNVDVDCKANAHVQDRRLANHVCHAGEVPRGVCEGGDRRHALHAYEIATRIGDACRASPGSRR
jgi:cation transport ATPase